MRLLLLGTAAAEAWPAPFCRCPACQQARALGGRNIRSRSGALIDNDLKIDWGPDSVSQTQRFGLDLSGLRTLVFTHQHSDHIVPSELAWVRPPFTATPPDVPITVYGNSAVLTMLQSEFADLARQNLDLRLLEPFGSVTTPAGDEILPLPAEHVSGALLLRITRGGHSLLYGHDSGLFPDETVQALAGSPLHAALFDCTYGLSSQNVPHQKNEAQNSIPGDSDNFLVGFNLAYEKDLLRAEAKKFGLSFVDLANTRFPIDREAIKAVPEHIVRRYTVIPIKRDGNKLMVAICDVNTSSTGLDHVRLASGCQITPVLATRPGIERTIDRTYGSQASIGGGHMNFDGVLQTIERLRSVGAVTPESTLIATHFSHNGRLLHDELVERFAPYGVQVAYDGMTLDILGTQ